MSLSTDGLRSNVASFAFELAPVIAVLAAEAMSGFSEMTPSKDLSACSLDLISVCVVAMSAVPLTWRFVTAPPKPCFTPSQRCCRPMLFCSWMTQSTFLTPSDFSRAPAALPAIVSVWPTCVIAPSALESSAPEFSVMIGMPAALAFASESLIALAFGTDTARPSTFWETAASMSCASFCGSLFDGLQISLTPSSLAACWAPFLTTDQNEPSSLCVTIANVRPLPWVWLTPCDAPRGGELEPLLALLLVDLLLPPPPQPAATSATTARTAAISAVTWRFIGWTPSLSSEPVWTGTRCSCAHRGQDQRRPRAPTR